MPHRAAGRIVIAIDGPAASGKSSTAQWVAKKLGYSHVDSGALYRAITAAAVRRSADAESWTEDFVLDGGREIRLVPDGHSFSPTIGGERVDEQIRGPEVTRSVSRVARMQRVRDWVNEQVKSTAGAFDIVVDGRDMGTAVFPGAQLKVFLVADPWERARRRLVQQLGHSPTDEEIAEETDRLVRRDAGDSTQTVQAPDAVLIDTTFLTQEEQVERIVALAKAVSHRTDES
ncbi:MAG TPA: (d)CMP kinase [Gemmatimonadaceae bacterium]|nr:(d)CMP kinase [Gemmatimonadaceae bacterium]